jgi:tetratricopeptide (TPR) repeat protein
MRKRTGGGIAFITITIVFVGSHYAFPKFNYVVNVTANLVTDLGVLVTFFLWWYSNQSEKKPQEKSLERKLVTILSPISDLCIGRSIELSQLEKDLEHRNVLLIKGIPGIGKTTLGRKFKERLDMKGYQTLWHQFDSQSYENLLLDLSKYLEDRGSVSAVHLRNQQIVPEKRLETAVRELCNYPTVLFLDNFQVFEDDSDFGVFTDYLINSHLVIMSRTQPRFFLEAELLMTLNVKEPREVLEKIYEKTRGHPWSLVCFSKLSRVLPVLNLLEELPDFGREQQIYIFEQCWKYLDDMARDFLMRASVFTKPLSFSALKICSKVGLSEILISLAESFYITKRGQNYFIHDIIKDFAFLRLKENQELYVGAQREAAGFYQKNLSAESLLLIYYHLTEAGDRMGAVDQILCNIGYFWREGFWSDVVGVLEESLEFSKEKKTIADIYYALGTIIDRQGKWDKAAKYYEKSLKIKEKLGNAQSVATIYNSLGSIYADKGESRRAIGYYKKSLEISEAIADTVGVASVYGNLGSIYYRKGRWDRAIEYYEKSLEIYKKLENVHRIALVYNNLGSIYADKGKWSKALEYYEKSLEIKWKFGDAHGMALTRGNLGLVYSEGHKWKKSQEYYEESLEVLTNFGDSHGIAQVYNNLGEMNMDRGEWKKAMEFYERDLEISGELGDIHGIALTKCNIANTLRSRKGFNDALELYLESEVILKKYEDKFNLMKVYYCLSACYHDMRLEDESEKYLGKAERLRKQLGIETLQVQ